MHPFNRGHDEPPRPHTVVSEHLEGDRWAERARQPVTVPLRRLDDLQRYVEALSAVAVLLVRAEQLHEDRVRLRVLDRDGRTLAVVHGDGSITTTSGKNE